MNSLHAEVLNIKMPRVSNESGVLEVKYANENDSETSSSLVTSVYSNSDSSHCKFGA